MPLSLDLFPAPRWPSGWADPSTDTKNWALWRSCPRDHSPCSMKTPSAADIIAVSSIHATLLADRAWKCLTLTVSPQTDNASIFHESTSKLLAKADHILLAFCCPTTTSLIRRRGYSSCARGLAHAGDGAVPEPPATT